MKNIYKNIYKKNKLDIKKNIRVEIMSKLINNLDLKNKNILDIGCYDGTLLSNIKNKNNLFGIEASDYGVLQSSKKNINVTQFFFNDNEIPYESNKFDLVIIGEIIEHIYDTDKFLSEIYRILKPNGKLLISTPNIASFGRRIMLLIGINPIIETSPNRSDSSGHIRYFTYKSLNDLLASNNFIIDKYQSDLVNFSKNGKYRSIYLAVLFPKIGQSIITLCSKR